MTKPRVDQPATSTAQVAAYLTAHHLVVVTAESCTAGLIAAELAGVPGAGQVFECAFVVYDPKAKMRCLQVPAQVLAKHNLSSEAVALAMARGALLHSGATVAIANTGLADDSDPDLPKGTQCYAWLFKGPSGTQAFTATRRFGGSRNAIRRASAHYALACVPHYHQLALVSPPARSHKEASP